MRISHLPTLVLCLSIGGLAVYGMHDAASAATLSTAPPISTRCQALPAPTPSPTASASSSPTASPTATASSPPPAELCVSVQASQDTFPAGQPATWSVQVSAPNGPVTGVSVTLAGTLAGQQPTFTGKCPSGDGSPSCTVGDMATDLAAASDTMQAQITVPSGTAVGTSVTLSATANATPSLPTAASADTAVTVAAAPAATSSPSPAKSASPAPSRQPSATASATPPATTPGVGTRTLPGIGTIPGVTGPVAPQSAVTAITNPGSVGGLLPVVTPGASATSPTAGFVTSPAADVPANPGATTGRTTASNFVLVVSAATAEKIGGVILLLVAVLALRLRARDRFAPRVVPDRASRGQRGGPSRARRLKLSAILHPRRQRGDSPK